MRLSLPLTPAGLDLLDAWGVPYSYGAGTPSDGVSGWPDGCRGVRGGIGWDCSGFAQAALVRLGLLDQDKGDRSAAALSLDGAVVKPGTEKLGDLAFYGISHISHVMVVMSTGVVLGASGGWPSTNGDDPKAFVQLHPLHYRPDLVAIRRFTR